MGRLYQGALAPGGWAFDTRGEQAGLAARLQDGRTALWFLRDQSCVLARYHLFLMAQAAEVFLEKGWRMLAIVDSDPAVLERESPVGGWPFPVLCGDEALFRRWGIGTAASAEVLGGPHVQEAIARAKNAGFVHGTDSGDPLRLPAVFGVAEGKIVYCHYAATGEDLPDPTETLSALA